MNPYWSGLAVTCASTIVIWLFSIANNNSSIYDPYWVIAPPILAVLLVISSNGFEMNLRQLIIIGCFVVWASRYHIFYKWTGWRTGLQDEDWRYEDMRKYPVPYWLNSLLGMHIFPTLLVYFAFAPGALVLLTNPAQQSNLGIWDILGVFISLSAVIIQLISDEQLRKYRMTDEYKNGGSFRGGLWKYSRHPNYFGEVVFWLSMILFALGSGIFDVHPFLVLTGPIVMAIFFRFSAYLTDMRSLKRRDDYPLIMREVSALIPWWPRKR